MTIDITPQINNAISKVGQLIELINNPEHGPFS